QQAELARLRELELVGARPVDDRDRQPLEVAEVLEGVEDRGRVVAQVGRWADPVDDQPVSRLGRAGVVAVLVGEDRLVGPAAPLQLGEERTKPLRMLVEDADRPGRHGAEVYQPARQRSSRACSQGLSSAPRLTTWGGT